MDKTKVNQSPQVLDCFPVMGWKAHTYFNFTPLQAGEQSEADQVLEFGGTPNLMD